MMSTCWGLLQLGGELAISYKSSWIMGVEYNFEGSGTHRYQVLPRSVPDAQQAAKE